MPLLIYIQKKKKKKRPNNKYMDCVLFYEIYMVYVVRRKGGRAREQVITQSRNCLCLMCDLKSISGIVLLVKISERTQRWEINFTRLHSIFASIEGN